MEQHLDGKGVLTVSVVAGTDLYDLCLEVVPHVNGHFTRNFVNLAAGDTLQCHFVPTDPQANLEQVKVEARTLNDLMTR